MTNLIQADNLTVIRNTRTILENVSMRIAAQDFVTLVGPNGAGKTMLLKCLLGFFKPEKGEVSRKAGLRVGYMPQKISLDAILPMPVRQFLNLNLNNAPATIEELAEETDITSLLTHRLHEISSGEMQRVLLARALIHKPDLLILDEPAQNLDVSGQLAFYKKLEKIYDNHRMAILMVSHDLHLVMASTRQVICLYHHICCAGTPQSVTQDPEFIALFGNDMARMMAVYPHHHDHDHSHDHDHNHDKK
ncbi:MAG: ATP-binding cassette domain-containing protein [Alphaproteobacteria bacterium]|nr:ATP-binding cassette domain-containing protein [Alphaproteobacteria bacterium]